MEAKEKARRGREPKGDQDTDNGIEISIKVGESMSKPTKSQGADDAIDGSKVVSQEGTSKQLKIIVEASDKIESTKSGDQTTSGEIKQPAEGGDKQAEDAKQALERTKDERENKRKKGEDTDVKGVSTTESGQESGKEHSTSTFGVTPATSAESISATEDSNKVEGQPSAKLDENAVAGEEVTDTKATTKQEEMRINPTRLNSTCIFKTPPLMILAMTA